MKRRKRKQASKAADQATLPVDAEKPPVPADLPADTEKPAVYVEELQVPAEMPPDTELPTDAEEPPLPAPIPAVSEEPAAGSLALAGPDRRTHPRYPFTAAIEVVASLSGAGIVTRVRDLSWQGCYVDTSSPLSLETVADIRITKGKQSFAARARVVYTQAGKGMGLMFTDVEKDQLGTLDTWLNESRETSWLAANRRRSQRVLMKIPVRVSGQNVHGSPFDEDTHTLAISAHGALLPVSTPVNRGQRITLANVQTKSASECVVAHVDKLLGEQIQVGVEFRLPNPTFWRVAFPPKDWTPRHPHAKPPLKKDPSR